MGQFATLISNSFSAPLPPRNVVTPLCLCTVRRILAAIDIASRRGVSANDSESLNMVMVTAYRYLKQKCTLSKPFCILSRKFLAKIVDPPTVSAFFSVTLL